MSSCQVCTWGIQYHLCGIYRGLWGLVVVWLSARALAAQARGALGSTPGDCQLFHFTLFSPHNINFANCSSWTSPSCAYPISIHDVSTDVSHTGGDKLPEMMKAWEWGYRNFMLYSVLLMYFVLIYGAFLWIHCMLYVQLLNIMNVHRDGFFSKPVNIATLIEV